MRLRRAMALCGLFTAGCTVGPPTEDPRYPTSDGVAAQEESWTSPESVEAAWWTTVEDPTLVVLVDAALDQNRDVREAAARVLEARAFAREAVFDLAPIVPSELAYERAEASERTAVGAFGGGDPTDLFRAGFDATWELDFFGRVRSSVDAASADARAAEATLRDVRVTVVGDVAAGYLTLRGTQRQLDVARRNAENQRVTVDLTEALLRGGRGTALDTSRARAQWSATRATIPALEAQVRVAIHRLGVLTGRTPDRLVAELLPEEPLPVLPETLRIGSVEDFLYRRPDVRAAERRLAAATARVRVVTADLYPRVVFVGSVSLQADAFSGLGASGSGAYAFGPRISWPAFDLGRVRQQVVGADASAEAALAAFEQTVLLALEEVDNALIVYGREREQLRLLRDSAEASARAAELARIRYQDGVSGFLEVLDAESRLLEAEDLLAQSETRTAVAWVVVHKALASHR